MPKPIRIEAKSLVLFFFDTKRIAAPTAMHKGAKEDGFSSIKKILSLEISPKRRICPVTVVPMFAPKITGTACTSFIIPALTNPTAIMAVAAELWMAAVTIAPSATPFSRLLVSFSSVFSKPAPAIRSKEELKSFIPYKNRPIPPQRVMTDITVKRITPILFLFVSSSFDYYFT